MAFGTVLFAAVLAVIASGRCPTITCGTLDGNLCAKQTLATAYTVNDDGCDSGYVCSLQSYLTVLADTTIQGKTVPCTVKPSGTTSTTWSPKSCLTKAEDKDWMEGGSLLLCQSDGDCKMKDGKTTTCLCVPRSDSKGVCQPDPNNQALFSEYWVDCGSTNVIAEEDAYNYWNYAFQAWAYTQSDVSCSDIFYEIDTYDSLKSTYESADTIALAVLSLLY